MKLGVSIWVALLFSACGAEKWRWPETAESVRIDTKVSFDDEKITNRNHDNLHANIQEDDIPFKEPLDTDGFYNRPPGAGRYPVKVEAYRSPYNINEKGIHSVHKQFDAHSDGTLDSLQYCKCVSHPDCDPKPNSESACGLGKFLCCYKRPNSPGHHNSEYFNEINDERPVHLPGKENVAPFLHPVDTDVDDIYGPFAPAYTYNPSATGQFNKPQGVLIGPYGPTGQIGPQGKPNGNRPVLIGPGGPTGITGPHSVGAADSGVLVGPDGPTGIIGPVPAHPDKDIRHSETAQRGVLIGPGGPTGIIGPYGRRPVLVGPGGPTGIIGPGRRGNRQGLLVGPGGPTGIIGPAGYRQPNGLLIGPGGPTGIVGSNRPILVGPGGPTGQIGPSFFD